MIASYCVLLTLAIRALAEYKWVRLREGDKLTIIDIYDECTRGLSGTCTLLMDIQHAIHADPSFC